MKHNGILIGKHQKKIIKFLDFFSFFRKLISGLACLHSIQGNGGNNLQSQEYFAHA
jgi:hypothetical protein